MEIKDILNKFNTAIESAKKDYFGSFMKKDFENCTYYQGIHQGLQDALQLIGMLDNEHNRLKSSP